MRLSEQVHRSELTTELCNTLQEKHSNTTPITASIHNAIEVAVSQFYQDLAGNKNAKKITPELAEIMLKSLARKSCCHAQFKEVLLAPNQLLAYTHRGQQGRQRVITTLYKNNHKKASMARARSFRGNKTIQTNGQNVYTNGHFDATISDLKKLREFLRTMDEDPQKAVAKLQEQLTMLSEIMLSEIML